MSSLVIGYGNPLRCDDGVGPRVAELLLEGPPGLPPGAAVIACHQLTPELAEDLANADAAVFVDADVTLGRGAVRTSEVEPAGGPTPWSHHLTPAALLGLARRLYGRAPRAVVVAVGAASTEPGEGLSREVEDALPRIVEQVLGALERR